MSDKFEGVHPDLVSKTKSIIAAMGALGFDMRVVQGLRTQTEQQALYAQGRTIPGKIVTNADGIKNKSNHQAHPDDGFGHAVDLAFFIQDKPSWDDKLPWRCYGECAKALGLQWGGDWKNITDKPHIELP